MNKVSASSPLLLQSLELFNLRLTPGKRRAPAGPSHFAVTRAALRMSSSCSAASRWGIGHVAVLGLEALQVEGFGRGRRWAQWRRCPG